MSAIAPDRLLTKNAGPSALAPAPSSGNDAWTALEDDSGCRGQADPDEK